MLRIVGSGLLKEAKLKLAIYGYDTIVGKMVLEMLDGSEEIHLDDFFPLSPLPLDYDAVPLRGKNYRITHINEFDFAQADVVLFCTTRDASETWIPLATSADCIVVDDSHLFAGDDAVERKALILKELNPFQIKSIMTDKIAAVPLATSTETALALGVVHENYPLRRAVVTAMVSASEHGELGTDTLARETTQMLNGMGTDSVDFPAQLAFNIHPRVGELIESGHSSHEKMILSEVNTLLSSIDTFNGPLSLTCLQVPTFYGNTLSVHVELEKDAGLDDFIECFRSSDCCALEEDLLSEDITMISPVSCAELEDKLYISRVRKTGAAAFDFVVIMDNIRYGEARTCINVLSLIQEQLA